MLSKLSFGLLACLALAAATNAEPFFERLPFTHSTVHRSPLQLFTGSFGPVASSFDTDIDIDQPLHPLATRRVASHVWPDSSIDRISNGPLSSFYRGYEPEEVETEFVPLEKNAGSAKKDLPSATDTPYHVSKEDGQDVERFPSIAVHKVFPFLGHDIFRLGGFGEAASFRPQWWRGTNVCVDKKIEESEEQNYTPLIGDTHFAMSRCNDHSNKHVCVYVNNRNGKTNTTTVTYKCCYGYGRPENAGYSTPCEKVEVKHTAAAAAELGGKRFIDHVVNSSEPLLSKDKRVTLFVPKDEAFAEYADQLQNENNRVDALAEPELKDVHKLHAVDAELELEDIENEKVVKSKLDGQTIRINRYPQTNRMGYTYTANCVPIESHGKISEQALIHTIKGVLKPVTKSLMELIRSRADMSIMRTVLEKTKLSELLEGENPMTIFVPVDSAFDKLDAHTKRALKEGNSCAATILKNHMLDWTLCSIAARNSAKNLLNKRLKFTTKAAPTEESEIADLLGQEQRIMVNDKAKLLETDLMGNNGVLQVIDTILIPDSVQPLASIFQKTNATIFSQLLEASGYADLFTDYDNVTLFVPLNKALEGTKWPQMLKENPESLKQNPELLEFLKYHVIKPKIRTCDLTEGMQATAAGPSVRINLYSTHALASHILNRATVNCARLVHFDNESCGKVVHQIDHVLSEPKSDLLHLLESNPEYSQFLNLVRSANLTHLLADAAESYTVLVPRNYIFEELEANGRKLFKTERDIERLVKTHVIKDVVCCTGIAPVEWPFVRTLDSLNGQKLQVTSNYRRSIEKANIARCDIVATNGVLHEIDDIIKPQQPQHLPTNIFRELNFF